VKKVFDILEVASHDAGTVLEFYNPLELFIVTILSVQTTGKLVNKVPKTLSKRI
jgi:endonuclease III